MRLKLMAPLKSDPHTAFDYCSTAYALLGRLIEKLTGEDLDSYAAKRLFKPLGMTDTHFNLPKEKWHRVLKRDPSFCFAGWLNSDFVLTDLGGAGSMKSTVRDLAQLGQMYLQEGTLDGNELLSPATVRLLTTNHNARLPDSFWFGRILGSAWGLGWHVRCGKRDDLGLLRSDRTYDHGGAGGARLVIDPDARPRFQPVHGGSGALRFLHEPRPCGQHHLRGIDIRRKRSGYKMKKIQLTAES